MTSYPQDGFVLRARKVGTTTWDTLFNKSGSNLNTAGGGTTVPGTFQTELIYMPASYVGSDAIFELRGNSGFGPDLFIDDFEVKAVHACPDPGSKVRLHCKQQRLQGAEQCSPNPRRWC